jgi:hypothetical protein
LIRASFAVRHAVRGCSGTDALITLSFLSDTGPLFVRGAFFRICSDGTLLGPEGSLVANYTPHGWRLGDRKCREFEALGPLLLRANFADGRREQLGRYEAVRSADGALFSRGQCLGIFCMTRPSAPGTPEWSEITLLDGGQ